LTEAASARLTDSSLPCRLGVLAFGDSITNGGGELQWGVALQSWAHWVARGLGLPFTGYAIDGNRADDVIRTQIPAFLARSADPDAQYQLGCLYIGVNDIRALDWSPEDFGRDFRRALEFLHARCERVVTLTIPRDLGRPRTGVKVDECNRLIESIAAQTGALVVPLEDFGARNLMMVDHVHPTAFGQIAIAERVLAALEVDGMVVRAAPHNLVFYDITSAKRLRSDATYVYRHAKVSVKAAAIRFRVRARPGARSR
jgi:lysophospholipase L1-like esterase